MERLSSSAGGGPASPTPPTTSTLGANWPAQVAETIETVVGSVRDKTVKPATVVVKALVYGPVAAVVGAVAAVMVAVAAVRALNEIPGTRDWISLVGIGGFFSLAGLFLLERGRSAARKASKR